MIARYRFPALGLVLFLFVWGLTTHGKFSNSGDEPHYLTIARSLALDRDLDLRNNYADERRNPELHARPALDGRLQSTHDIGLPLLLAPVYGLAHAIASGAPPALLRRVRMPAELLEYAIVSLTMLAFVCWSLTRLARALTAVTSGGRAIAVAAIVGVSPPILSHSFLIFPESVAFMAGCAVVAWIYSASPRPWSIWLLAAALGYLPWCHRKFSLFVVACAVSMIAMRVERWRAMPAVERGALGGLFIIPHAAFHLWTLHTWGNLGGPQMLEGLPFTWTGIAHGAAGLFMDRQSGLVAGAPLYLPIFACWIFSWFARRETRWLLLPVASLVLPMSAYATWWGGFAPAARYLVPIVPFCAVAMAESLRAPGFRVTGVSLAVVQIIIACAAWSHPRLLWPQDAVNPLLEALGPIGRAYARFLPPLQTGALAQAIVPLTAVAALSALLVVTSRGK